MNISLFRWKSNFGDFENIIFLAFLCQIEEKEILKTKTNTNEDFKSNITVENSLQVSQEIEVEDQPQLGDFDDTFTWSAEVLAAQGKKIDQFSLNRISEQGIWAETVGFPA